MAKILPKYKIEVSFTASNTTGLSWTDITTDVRLGPGIPISWGRTDAFADVTASTASFTVDNNTGTYTPGNTGSAYYPNVSRGRAVRISATEDNPASYTQIYYGFIDTITPAWDNATGLIANAQITCVDLSSVLSRQSLTQPLVEWYTTIPGEPTDWWPLDDLEGTVRPVNTTGTTQVVAVNQTASPAITYQTDGVPYGGDGHSVSITGMSLNAAGSALYDFNVGWTIGCFFQLPNGAGAGAIDLISLADSQAFADFAVLQVLNDGSVGYSIDSGSIVDLASGSSHQVDDGAWHHAMLSYDTGGGGSPTLYVDGLQVATVLGLGTTSPALPIIFLVQIITAGTINIQHVMAWQLTLTPAEILAIAQAGLNGFSGETSIARVQRIAAIVGLTPTIVGTAGVTSMAPWHDTAGSFWDMMTLVAKTEDGILYIDRLGALTFRTRLSLYNQTVALTMGSGTYEDSLKFAHDSTNFFNQYTATAYGSTNPQTVTNATSYANDGVYNDSFTVETSSDLEALSYAQIRVTTTGVPLVRLPQLDVDMISQQTLFAALLVGYWTLDPGDLITVSSMPSAAPASSVSLFAQGATSTLTDTSYDATLNLSGGPAGQTAAWILQDAVFGVLDSTTILA